MAENSSIEWTTHTFNPWIGCARVSPACEHCYAEAMARRYGWAEWGLNTERRITSPSNWLQPIKWNRQAHRTATRARVFCASLADVFEDRRDLDVQRTRLFGLIDRTEHLDWLLLTKRPEAIARLVTWRTSSWPANVWLGTTVENQTYADRRIPHLIHHPAVVRFLSVEPQLGPVDLRPYLGRIDWVICGGESGPGSRPTAIEWARSVRDQCVVAGVSFFFKQWGNHAQAGGSGERLVRLRTKNFRVLDGREWSEIPTPRRSRTPPRVEAGTAGRTRFDRIATEGADQ